MYMNLPNKLTLFRIFLVPLLVVLIITKFNRWLAASIFSLAALTDWLDGYIARSTRQVTALGQLLDPIADKLLITAAFISLVEAKGIPAWIVVVIVGRELAVTGLRAMAAARKQKIIEAQVLGKAKTVMQTVAIILVILGFSPLDQIILWVALILTVVSGVEYFLRFYGEYGL